MTTLPRLRCARCGRFATDNQLTGRTAAKNFWCDRCGTTVDFNRKPQTRRARK